MLEPILYLQSLGEWFTSLPCEIYHLLVCYWYINSTAPWSFDSCLAICTLWYNWLFVQYVCVRRLLSSISMFIWYAVEGIFPVGSLTNLGLAITHCPVSFIPQIYFFSWFVLFLSLKVFLTWVFSWVRRLFCLYGLSPVCLFTNSVVFIGLFPRVAEYWWSALTCTGTVSLFQFGKFSLHL